jgi:hypothetical protein
MNLSCLYQKHLDAITTQVENTIVGVEMNEQFVFILCSSKKLKIFEIQTANFIKEIETSANQIKLAPSKYLILFDSINRQVHLYEQFGEFCQLNKVDLTQSLETDDFMINCDKPNTLAFYNSKCKKYISLDSISGFI